MLFVTRDAYEATVLARLDPRSGRIALLGRLDGALLASGLALSVDGLGVVYAREERKDADLIRITQPPM